MGEETEFVANSRKERHDIEQEGILGQKYLDNWVGQKYKPCVKDTATSVGSAFWCRSTSRNSCAKSH